MKFAREAGRSAARLIVRRTIFLGLFTAATWPVWSGHVVPYLAVTHG